MSKQRDWTGTAASLLQTGLEARCPPCGRGRSYPQMLAAGDNCSFCQPDYWFADSRDGPAVVVMLIPGLLIMGLTLIVGSSLRLQIWMQAILWIPTIIAACWWALNYTKTPMVALQYKSRTLKVVAIEEV